jgi:hypothetical protein
VKYPNSYHHSNRNTQHRLRRGIFSIIALSALVSCNDNTLSANISSERSPTSSVKGHRPIPRTKVSTPPACIKRPDIDPRYDAAAEALRLAHQEKSFSRAMVLAAQIDDDAIQARAIHGIEAAMAADAAIQAYMDNQFTLAKELAGMIHDDELHTAAEHAIDKAEAQDAASIAWADDNFAESAARTEHIEDSVVKAAALTAIKLAQNEHTLRSQTPPDEAEWLKADMATEQAVAMLDMEAHKAWQNLNTQAAFELIDVIHMTTWYCQPMTKANG